MNKEKNVIVGPKQETIKEFFKFFQKDYPNLLNNNVVVDLSNIIIKKVSEVLVFLKTAQAHREKGTSFVLIIHGIDIDKLPEELNIAPTMVEALDIIEMEEISRDLGF